MVHQSTADEWPQPLMTSGAMYSSVPTKDYKDDHTPSVCLDPSIIWRGAISLTLVRKSATHDLVSMSGMPFAVK